MKSDVTSSRLKSDITDDDTISNKKAKDHVDFNTLPNEVLVGISYYLDKTSCCLLAVALTASSSSWRKYDWNIKPSEASRIVLSTASPSAYRKVHFRDDEKFLAAKLTDEDIGGYLVCANQVPWLVPTTELSLKHCINVEGCGLSPLRLFSTYLRKIDLRSGTSEGNDSRYTSRLSEEAVIPILDSIVRDYPRVRDYGISSNMAMAIYNEVRGGIASSHGAANVVPDMNITTGFYVDRRSCFSVTPRICLIISSPPHSRVVRYIRPNHGYRTEDKVRMNKQIEQGYCVPVSVNEAIAIWNREFELADIPEKDRYQFSCSGRHWEMGSPFYFTLPKHWCNKQSQTVLRFLQNYNTMMNRTNIVCSNQYQQQPSLKCINVCRGTQERPWVNLSGDSFGTFNLTCDRYEHCSNTFCVDCAIKNELRPPCEKCTKRGCNKRPSVRYPEKFCSACDDCGD